MRASGMRFELRIFRPLLKRWARSRKPDVTSPIGGRSSSDAYSTHQECDVKPRASSEGGIRNQTGEPQPRRWVPFSLALLAVGLLAAVDAVTFQVNGERLSSAEIAFYRSLISLPGIIIFEIVRLRGIVKFIKSYASHKLPRWHAVQGIVYFLSAVTFIKAFASQGFVLSYVASFLFPLWVMALGVILLKKKTPNLLKVSFALMSFIGASLIITAKQVSGSPGQLPTFGLCAGFLYAAEILLAEKAESVHGTTAYQTSFYALVVNALVAYATFRWTEHPFEISQATSTIALTGALSLFATLAIFMAISKGAKCQPKIGSESIAPFDYLILPVNVAGQIYLCKYVGIIKSCAETVFNWTVFFCGALILGIGLAGVLMEKEGALVGLTDRLRRSLQIVLRKTSSGHHK